MTRSERASARRIVLTHLKEIKATASLLSGWWNVTGSVYVEPADRKPGDNMYLRDRQASEYPESQRRYWASTVNEIDMLTARLAELREHCLTEYHQTPEGN
jgi:hypothetical protein